MKDLRGQKFGRLTAIRQNGLHPGRTEYRWLCRCDCGTRTNVRVSNLTSGRTRSCGCIIPKPDGNPTHRMSKTRAYYRWKYHRRVGNTRLPFVEWWADARN